MRHVMRSVQFLIRLYQYVISPYIQSSCRFHPSCSQYALDALAYHGVGKGLWLSCRRLLRCHPWADGGYDPVLSFNEKEKP